MVGDATGAPVGSSEESASESWSQVDRRLRGELQDLKLWTQTTLGLTILTSILVLIVLLR